MLDMDTVSIVAATSFAAQAAAALVRLLTPFGVYIRCFALGSVNTLIFGGLLALGGLLLFILSAAANSAYFWKIAVTATCKLVGAAAALVSVDPLGSLFSVSVVGGMFWDFGSGACDLFR